MEVSMVSSLAIDAQSKQSPAPSLKELVAQDKDLLDFFRMVHKEDLRMKASEALQRKIEA